MFILQNDMNTSRFVCFLQYFVINEHNAYIGLYILHIHIFLIDSKHNHSAVLR